jgi:hypothetical protein
VLVAVADSTASITAAWATAAGTFAAAVAALGIAVHQTRRANGEREQYRMGHREWLIVPQPNKQFALMNRGHLNATDVTVTASDPKFITFLGGAARWSSIQAGAGEAFTALYDVIPGRSRDPVVIISWKADGKPQRPYRRPLPLERGERFPARSTPTLGGEWNQYL